MGAFTHMSVPLPPLEAYRRDVERRSTQEPFGEADGSWVVLATALWQQAYRPQRTPVEASALTPRLVGAGVASGVASGVRRADGAPHETLLWRVLDRGWIEHDVDTTAAEVLRVAAAIEDAGALLLAQAVLAALARLAAPRASALTCGRALAQRARVERQLGHFDVAEDLYTDAGRLGASAGIPDLQVRSDLGRGVLARIRGNYPEARRLFRRGLRRAERAGLRELTGIAHEGLMVAATAARDFDAALMHGWAALAHAAGNPLKEADVLHNLADVCRQAGELDAALQGFLAAAERGAPRIRVAALANAAHAAALLGQRALLEQCASRCEAELPTDAMPYERAQRLLTLATAWTAAGDAERAAGYRHRGLELAWANRFTELLVRQEAVERPAPTRAVRTVVGGGGAPPALDTGGRRVVRALSALPVTALVGT
jgi:tetratricopeptide (TPR) repeat protein